MAARWTTRTWSRADGLQVDPDKDNQVEDRVLTLAADIGSPPSDLDTDDNTSVVAAINELVAKAGAGTSRTLRLFLLGMGIPLPTAAGTPEFERTTVSTNGALQAPDNNAHSGQYAIDQYLQALGTKTLTKLRIHFNRSSASAVCSASLVKQALAGGALTAVAIFSVSDSSGTWVSEDSGALTEAYDPDNYCYYVEVIINTNASNTEVAVKYLEVEYELDS